MYNVHTMYIVFLIKVVFNWNLISLDQIVTV